MSICPTCGHWTAEPVPEGLEDSIKPCRTCARRQRSGDAELVESVGKYHVRCYGCHLSTGDYNDPREAVEEWNALWEGVEQGTDDRAVGMAFLRKCSEKYKAALFAPSKTLGPMAVTFLLDGIMDRLYILESMLRGDGEWRKQNRWPMVQEMLEWEAENKGAKEGAAVEKKAEAEGVFGAKYVRCADCKYGDVTVNEGTVTCKKSGVVFEDYSKYVPCDEFEPKEEP